MVSLFDFNTVLGKILFVMLILVASHFHILAGVLVVLFIISIEQYVVEGMENKEELSSKEMDGSGEDMDESGSNDSVDSTDVTDSDDIMTSFKKNNCKHGMLMKAGKEVTSDLIKTSFPDIKFLGDACNPCDDDCKFEIVSSNERLTAEEKVTPIDSATISVDREKATKKQEA